MAGTFRPRQSSAFSDFSAGPDWTLDWMGDAVVARKLEAARLAINDVSHLGANMAREVHPWRNRTGQTEASLFTKGAIIETAPLRVWGEWGVEDNPRFAAKFRYNEETGFPEYEMLDTYVWNEAMDRPLSTKDVALFLEFGTVKMDERPWLYPAWDATKIQLPGLVVLYSDRLNAMNGGRGWLPRSPGGAFRSIAEHLSNPGGSLSEFS